MKRVLGSALMFAFLSSPAFAQARSVPEPKCNRDTNRCIDFGAVKLEGNKTPVSGIYQTVRRPAQFENLIKQRMSFEPELEGSVDHL